MCAPGRLRLAVSLDDVQKISDQYEVCLRVCECVCVEVWFSFPCFAEICNTNEGACKEHEVGETTKGTTGIISGIISGLVPNTPGEKILT